MPGPRAGPASLQGLPSGFCVRFLPRFSCCFFLLFFVFTSHVGPGDRVANTCDRRPRRLPHLQQRALRRRAEPARVRRPGRRVRPPRDPPPQARPHHAVPDCRLRPGHLWRCLPQVIVTEGRRGSGVGDGCFWRGGTGGRCSAGWIGNIIRTCTTPGASASVQ